ncbi:hypothetical protein D1872_269080 [compost metagenome]
MDTLLSTFLYLKSIPALLTTLLPVLATLALAVLALAGPVEAASTTGFFVPTATTLSTRFVATSLLTIRLEMSTPSWYSFSIF